MSSRKEIQNKQYPTVQGPGWWIGGLGKEGRKDLFIYLFIISHHRISLLILERETEREEGSERYLCERETSIGCLPYML